MPWIINKSFIDIVNRNFPDPGPGGVLIQIVDPDMGFPDVPEVFRPNRFYGFEFHDVDDNEPNHISDRDAERLVKILRQALQDNVNVIVHCVAGLCRSGAVVEVGMMMGFEPIRVGQPQRMPNITVKRKMIRELYRILDQEDLVDKTV